MLNPKTLLLAALAACALSAPTLAQHVSLTLGKHTRHGDFQLTLGTRATCGYGRSGNLYRVWVPGHFETRCERIWIEGTCRRVFVPPVYQTRYDCHGRHYQTLIEPGYWKSVREPGHFENREIRVWVDGYWRTSP